MPIDQEAITAQLNLLAQHRKRLGVLMQQQATFGAHTSPEVITEIPEIQATIRLIKEWLRAEGVPVDDHPNDERQVHPETPFSPKTLYQLRAPISDFVGRADEIAQLRRALGRAREDSSVTCCLCGLGGVGKTELAYVVAQYLTPIFPDGQLVLELHGSSGQLKTPAQVLQDAIWAFDHDAERLERIDRLKSVYQNHLKGKRVLILADDAKDEDQVFPLIPPTGCVLLVTSRNRFSLPGMTIFDLETLPPADAEKLLLEVCSRIGEYAGELAKLCGYLPLALRVSASLLKDNDTRDVEHYLGQLRAERLKHLSNPDKPNSPLASMKASLLLSYDALDLAARNVLCQLGVFPASFNLEAAKAVVVVENDVSEMLELLRRRSLLGWEEREKRYDLHVLVGAFAIEQLKNIGNDSVYDRYVHYYSQLAEQMDTLSTKDKLNLFDKEKIHIDKGRRWAEKQTPNSVILIDYADIAVLVDTLRYKPDELVEMFKSALEIARRHKLKGAESTMHISLGFTYQRIGDIDRASHHYRQGLDAAEAIDLNLWDKVKLIWRSMVFGSTEFSRKRTKVIAYRKRKEAEAHTGLGQAYLQQRQIAKARSHFKRAYDLSRNFGDRKLKAIMFGIEGSYFAESQDVGRAIEYYRGYLQIAQELADLVGMLHANWNLGVLYGHQEDLKQALEFFENCVRIAQDIHHPDLDKYKNRLAQLRRKRGVSESTTS